MAVNATSLNSTLNVKYQTGTTPTGGPVIRQKSLNDVKADAMGQDVYDVAALPILRTEPPIFRSVYFKLSFSNEYFANCPKRICGIKLSLATQHHWVALGHIPSVTQVYNFSLLNMLPKNLIILQNQSRICCHSVLHP